MEKKNQQDNTPHEFEELLSYDEHKEELRQNTEKSHQPFINEHGVVIGDNFYDSSHSPLNNWSSDIDPEIMAGDQWVHPTNDIGWNTPENQAILRGEMPQSGRFMHPTQDVSYENEDEPHEGRSSESL